MGRLQNKSAVILGASKRDNMGQVIARRFMSEGARVVAAGRDRVELDRFAESSGATAIPCDITKKEDIEALAETSRRTLGNIDIAVNCSGWAKGGPFCDYAEADLVHTMNIQFKGPFQFFQVMLQHMD
jgi:2-hydroxycyclohexanecarboxyl-CoA dehydrogenase